MADALEAQPPPSRVAPIVAAVTVLVILLVIIAVLVGRGAAGTDESVDAAGVVAIAAIDATTVSPSTKDAAATTLS